MTNCSITQKIIQNPNCGFDVNISEYKNPCVSLQNNKVGGKKISKKNKSKKTLSKSKSKSKSIKRRTIGRK